MSANPFDEFRRAAPAANPFDEFQPVGPTTRQTLTTAVTMKAEAVAEAERLAKRYPAPPEVIMQDLEAYRLQEVIDLADTDLQKAPMLREVLRRDVRKAALAQDDIPTLSRVEAFTNALKRGFTRTLQGSDAMNVVDASRLLDVIGRIERGELKTDADIAKATPYASIFAGTGRTPEALARLREVANRNLAENAAEYLTRGQRLEDLPASREFQQFQKSATFGEAASRIAGSPVRITSEVVAESLGALAPAAPVIIGSGLAAGPVGLATAVGLTSAGTEYVNNLPEIFAKLGVDVNDLDAVRAAVRTPEFLEESRKAMVKAGIIGAFDAATAGVAGRALSSRPLRNVAAQVTVQGAGGGAGEAVGSVAIGEEINPAAVLSEIIGEVPGALIDVATLQGRRILREAGQRADAVAASEQLQQAMQVAGQSLLRERSPEQFRALMGEMTDGTIYVDGEVLNQLPPEVLAALPEAVREQIPTAAEIGSVVEIPVADVLTIAPGTPLEQVFMQNARTAPDAPSLAEAEEAGKKAQEFLQQEAARVIAQAQDQEALRQSQEAVKQNIRQQLAATGRFRDAVNEGYATWAAAFYTAYGSRLGLTPEQFYQRYPLRVLGAPVGQQTGVLNAGTASVTVRLGERDVPVKLGALDAQRGNVLVPVNAAAFDSAWRAGDTFNSFYIGPGGVGNTIGERYPQFGEFASTAPSIDASVVSVDENGVVGFGDGRHRFAFMRDQGVQTIPVAMDAESLQNAIAAGYVEQGVLNQSVTTMVPTTKGAVVDPALVKVPGIKEAEADDPKAKAALEANVGLFDKKVQVIADKEKRGYDSIKPAGDTPKDRAESIIDQMVRNLLTIYDAIPAAIRNRSRLWYDGANRISLAFAQRYDMTPMQSAAQLAVLSPQADWFMNVSYAERINDILDFRQDHTWDAEMDAWATEWIANSEESRQKESERRADAVREAQRALDQAQRVKARADAALEKNTPKLTEKIERAEKALSEAHAATIEVRKLAKKSGTPANEKALAKAEAREAAASDKAKEARADLREAKGAVSKAETAIRQAEKKLQERREFAAEPDPNVAVQPNIRGKKLSELQTDFERAWWVRAYDEAHHPRAYRVVTPEGGFLDFAKLDDGVSNDSIAWKSFNPIAKAISIRRDGSLANVHAMLGGEHKVRNFYNNIYAPNAPFPFVTSDTHQVAANLFLPLGADALEVGQNFGGTGTKSVSEIGLNGTYWLYSEAVAKAAKQRGVLPREMQSISWEAIRSLFSPTFKANSDSVNAVRDLWVRHHAGEASYEDTIAAIIQLAGGRYRDPSWVGVRPDSAAAPEAGLKSYESQLAHARQGLAQRGEPGRGDAGVPGSALPQGDVLNQPAFHGTPQRGITQFSTDFVGTGEGNQAYGWGLYFAGMREIAEYYRRTLGDWDFDYATPEAKQELRAATNLADGTWAGLRSALTSADGDAKKAAGILASQYQSGVKDENMRAAYRLMAQMLRDGRLQPKHTGQLYEVEIPEDSEMLLWDKPLSEQPEKVRGAITNVLKVMKNPDPAYSDEKWLVGFESANMDDVVGAFATKKEAEESILASKGSSLYQSLSATKGPRGASMFLAERGIKGIKYLDGGSRADGDGTYNYVVFSGDDVAIRNQFYQGQQQGARGTFNPQTLELVLNPNADLSTWFHETGHFFLEVLADVASQPDAPAQIAEDYAKVLAWFGVTPEQWAGFTLDQKRPYHERWAESIEQYVMEGKAPSVELQGVMRRFRAWLTSVYQSIKAFVTGKPELQLNDDIRRVMDRMLATDEQIAQANEVAGLMPDEQADAEAAERLQKRSMADLKWAVKARDKVIAALRRQALEIEKGIREQVTVEVDAMPEMQAKRKLDELRKTSPEYKAALKAWQTQRQAAKDAAAQSIRDNLLATEGAGLKGLEKGQFLARKKREIENQAEAAALAWEADNAKPERPLAASDLEVAAIADAFGYESVEQMLQAIDAFGKRADAIDGLTEQRMLEEHGDLVDERAIQEAANEAVHNEARARSLATELRTQREMLGGRTDTGEVNARGARITVNTLVEAAKQFGANVIARTPLKDLRATAWKHTAAERRAGKRWAEATAAGDTQAAVQAKQDQVLNNAAAKAALDAATEAKKILEFFRRVTKGNDEKVVEKGRDPDIVNAARAVLAAYGIETPASKGAAAYLETVKTNDPDTYAAIEPMIAAATQNAQPLEALTFEELQGLAESIQAMWHLAKRSRQMEVDGDLLDIDDVATELFVRLEEIGIPDRVPGEGMAVTREEERGLFLKQGIAFLRRVEQWAEGMDGKYGGPFLRFVFQPIKDAADRYRAERITYRKKFQALVDNLAPIVGDSVIDAPELGYKFGTPGSTAGTAMNEILHAIAHTGNESNKRKLLLGRGWATENPDGTLDTSRWDAFIRRLVNEGKLERAHFDFVQGVWDLLEEAKPLAQKAHRDAFGRYFSEVTADAFVDPFGVTRRGGYVPAQVDSRLVKDNVLRKMAEEENNSMAYAFPQPAKGFTMARTEYNRPLMLDLRSLSQHLDKVLLFSHMTNPARDVRKLLTRKTVSQPLDRIQPAAIESMLQPWLQRSAQQIVETPIVGSGKWARLPGLIRARAGMALMFANVSNAIQQVTGLAGAAVRVKPSMLMRSVAQYVANPVQFSRAVWDASPYMDDRAKNEVAVMNEQMQAILLKPSTYEKVQDWSMRHAYFLQTALDNVLSPIVWTGAFNQALADGMSDADAVRFADSTVRQTQGSTLPEDVSRFETGPAYARAFTQFVGYFNMMANTNGTALKQIANEVGLKKGAGKALYVVLMGLMVPIWVAEAIALAFKGGPEDEDDDGYLDDWLASVFGMGTSKGLLAQIPILGQFAVAAIQRFNDNPLDDRVSLSPAISLLESGVGAPQSVYKAIVEDGSAQKAIRDVATLVSVATGVPVYGLARPVGYAAGVAQGKIEPTSAADAARGVVTGTASPESKQR